MKILQELFTPYNNLNSHTQTRNTDRCKQAISKDNPVEYLFTELFLADLKFITHSM
jgi:hypothetical protein